MFLLRSAARSNDAPQEPRHVERLIVALPGIIAPLPDGPHRPVEVLLLRLVARGDHALEEGDGGLGVRHLREGLHGQRERQRVRRGALAEHLIQKLGSDQGLRLRDRAAGATRQHGVPVVDRQLLARLSKPLELLEGGLGLGLYLWRLSLLSFCWLRFRHFFQHCFRHCFRYCVLLFFHIFRIWALSFLQLLQVAFPILFRGQPSLVLLQLPRIHLRRLRRCRDALPRFFSNAAWLHHRISSTAAVLRGRCGPRAPALLGLGVLLAGEGEPEPHLGGRQRALVKPGILRVACQLLHPPLGSLHPVDTRVGPGHGREGPGLRPEPGVLHGRHPLVGGLGVACSRSGVQHVVESLQPRLHPANAGHAQEKCLGSRQVAGPPVGAQDGVVGARIGPQALDGHPVQPLRGSCAVF
mmetsp:Transcript_6786/g.19237  ORF Transcript_6786/g.19237 Transcript_6786/m.19237 type:complete len:411 (-) Transcript_6786:910-2142(-)